MSNGFKDATLMAFAAALLIAGVVTAPDAPAAAPPLIDAVSKACIGCHER